MWRHPSGKVVNFFFPDSYSSFLFIFLCFFLDGSCSNRPTCCFSCQFKSHVHFNFFFPSRLCMQMMFTFACCWQENVEIVIMSIAVIISQHVGRDDQNRSRESDKIRIENGRLIGWNDYILYSKGEREFIDDIVVHVNFGCQPGNLPVFFFFPHSLRLLFFFFCFLVTIVEWLIVLIEWFTLNRQNLSLSLYANRVLFLNVFNTVPLLVFVVVVVVREQLLTHAERFFRDYF